MVCVRAVRPASFPLRAASLRYLNPKSGKNFTLWPSFTFVFASQLRVWDREAYTCSPAPPPRTLLAALAAPVAPYWWGLCALAVAGGTVALAGKWSWLVLALALWSIRP